MIFDRLIRTNRATYDKAARVFQAKLDAHAVIRRYASGRRGYFIWQNSLAVLENGTVDVDGVSFKTASDADIYRALLAKHGLREISGMHYVDLRRKADYITSESIFTYLNLNNGKMTAVLVSAANGNFYFAADRLHRGTSK